MSNIDKVRNDLERGAVLGGMKFMAIFVWVVLGGMSAIFIYALWPLISAIIPTWLMVIIGFFFARTLLGALSITARLFGW